MSGCSGGMSGRSATVCWDGFVAYDVSGEEWRVVTGFKVFMYF